MDIFLIFGNQKKFPSLHEMYIAKNQITEYTYFYTFYNEHRIIKQKSRIEIYILYLVGCFGFAC